MKHLFQTINTSLTSGHNLVMATVVAASGSTPRGAGSRMIIGEEGLLSGTIGGGNVEYRSIKIAQKILQDKQSMEHAFRLNQEDISNLGMVCGGDVNVFFHYLDHQDSSLIELSLKALALLEERADFWLISNLTESSKSQGTFSIYTKENKIFGAFDVSEELLLPYITKPCRIREQGYDCFIEQIGHSETTYIFGGGHISQSLVPALSAVGFNCIVLDDREEFASKELFPDAIDTILCDFTHLEQYVTITENDLCCVLTRGHAYDTLVQAFLLGTPAYYIGVIGSRIKRAISFKSLVEDYHIPEKALERIHAPIGLNIKAVTPAEIAVSITAEMILARAEKRG